MPEVRTDTIGSKQCPSQQRRKAPCATWIQRCFGNGNQRGWSTFDVSLIRRRGANGLKTKRGPSGAKKIVGAPGTYCWHEQSSDCKLPPHWGGERKERRRRKTRDFVRKTEDAAATRGSCSAESMGERDNRFMLRKLLQRDTARLASEEKLWSDN